MSAGFSHTMIHGLQGQLKTRKSQMTQQTLSQIYIKTVFAKHKLEVNAGAVWRALPQTVSYEANIPLIYESTWYEKPKYLEKVDTDSCINMSIHDSPEYNIINNLNSLQNAFKTELASLAQSWNAMYLRNCSTSEKFHYVRKRCLDFLGDALNWCCSVATDRKLDLLVMNENTLKDTIFNLRKGLTQSIKTISENSVKFKTYEEAAAASFKKIEDHTHKLETILNKLKKDIDNHEIGQDRLLASIVTNEFHNLKHIIELTRAMKRQGAMTSCRQHQIPIHPRSRNPCP
ncbi:hypothetical protein JTB14_023879 [Gonioctena quinquepunctata]|nr:hypothetical protein JTB14_023879 [Gonioctena quinquepunctata]